MGRPNRSGCRLDCGDCLEIASLTWRPVLSRNMSGYSNQALTTNVGGGDNLCDMVDSELRLKAASLIRSYLSGEIDNLEFADGFPHDKNDPALRAIEQRLWFHYDDVRTHHCDFQLHSDIEMLFLRCALFLDTNLEYEWPELWHHNFAHPIIRILSGQVFRANAIKRAKSSGDYEVWPFLRKTDLENAKTQFGAGQITATNESFHSPATRAERLWQSIFNGVVYLQTAAFIGFFVCLLLGLFANRMAFAGCLACISLYFLLWPTSRLLFKAFQSTHAGREVRE